MLKSQNKSTSTEKCEYDIRASIDLDCITSLLIGEKEFYYYLIKYDMFLKTTLKVIWIDEQNKSDLEEIMPFIKYFSVDSTDPTVYVCQNYSCQLPTSDILKVTNLLK